MSAPSANNKQPWHFIVIDERGKLDQIASSVPNAKMCKEAPLAILICADNSIEEMIEYCIQNCSAATENLLLASHAKKLGSVWIGVYPKPEKITPIKNIIKLPDNIIPISLIAIGYPEETPNQKDNFNKSKIHYNKW
jgi:nitroreductase